MSTEIDGIIRQATELINQAYNRGVKAERKRLDFNAYGKGTEEGYQRGFEAGKEHTFQSLAGWTPRTLDEQIRDARQNGMEASWACLRDIRESMTDDEIESVFGVYDYTNVLYGIIDCYHPRDAIEKFNGWKEQNKPKTNGQKFKEVFGHVMPDDLFAKEDWWKEKYEEPEG